MLQMQPHSTPLEANQGIGVGAPATAFDRPFASLGGPAGVFIVFVELHCIILGLVCVATNLDPPACP